ncbi:hypothetical protein P7D22_21190 [Lichenihabitans sp. Uapishka_5]|uniref:hypothetical protein n=1 Tax=Lichenihabitans sp. Uapishka_5 TaxID=3037302 RepID=UPI0029E7F9D7|nr:hypothetical protein [Lichenihabitans sp. Uapishka_5]MDX7953682.1 hypothetical protein [Lichenihabitans sp. Uapishka_5]
MASKLSLTPMKTMIATCLVLAVVGWTAPARAEGKYQVTGIERAACESDAVALCSATYPDEDALLACMRLNVSKLNAGCRPVFIEGLRRRGIPMIDGGAFTIGTHHG